MRMYITGASILIVEVYVISPPCDKGVVKF